MRPVFYRVLVPMAVMIFALSIGARESAAQKPALELLDAKAAATTSSITLSGQVKNISSSDITGVTVYCDFQNGSGKVVRTEPTTLETDPLKPNGTADFKCSTKAGPEVKGYNMPRFERLFGGPLVVKDGRKK